MPQKRVGLFDTTSRPLGRPNRLTPPAPLPASSAAPPPRATGTKQITVDGVAYTVPADAALDEVADAVTAQIQASTQAPTAAPRPLRDQAGVLGGVASGIENSALAPLLHPIDTATSLAKAAMSPVEAAMSAIKGMADNLKWASDTSSKWTPPELLLGKALKRRTVEDATKRVEAKDLSGAAASAITSVAGDWLPVNKAVGLVGRGAESVGSRVSSRVLGVPRQISDPVLKEGFLKSGVASGLRQAEAQALDAASAATAAAPSGIRVSKPGARPQAPVDVIRRAEGRRLEALGEVAQGADPRLAKVATPASRGQYWRDQVRTLLPAEGRAAIDRISTLEPMTHTLANAPKAAMTSGIIPASMGSAIGYAVGGPVGAGLGGLAAGSAGRLLRAPIAHRLDRAGAVLNSGLTSDVIANMQRAAILARLMGRDDDQ